MNLSFDLDNDRLIIHALDPEAAHWLTKIVEDINRAGCDARTSPGGGRFSALIPLTRRPCAHGVTPHADGGGTDCGPCLDAWRQREPGLPPVPPAWTTAEGA